MLTVEHKNIPMTFDVYQGKDSKWVVHVCTDNMKEDINGPILRLYLNDECIYENPTLSDD